MPDFPIDVVVDILLRLPVKTLLRFRCVSKPFCALIDSHNFIRSHLKRSTETKNRLSLILRDSSLYYVDFDSLDNALKLDHPLDSRHSGTEVLGSCDGLVSLYDGEEDISIWNPSTRRCRKLPVEKTDFPDHPTICQYIIYGFGYDSVADDYKVVRLTQFYGNGQDMFESFESEVKVYSMKSNSWRRIHDFPYYLRYKRGYGMTVGSALHWVVSRKSESDTVNLIAAFDLTTEEYQLVPQPEFSDKNFHMNIGVLESCLCILCNYIDIRVEVWVMKDYGVKESWTKLFSVEQLQVSRSFEFMIPLAFSKTGCEVLLVQDNKELVWYDFKRKKIKKIKTCGMPTYFESFVYVQSLVPINGGDETYGKNQDLKRKKKKKDTPKKRDDFLSKGFKLVL